MCYQFRQKFCHASFNTITNRYILMNVRNHRFRVMCITSLCVPVYLLIIITWPHNYEKKIFNFPCKNCPYLFCSLINRYNNIKVVQEVGFPSHANQMVSHYIVKCSSFIPQKYHYFST
jgi:hypothetical protein